MTHIVHMTINNSEYELHTKSELLRVYNDYSTAEYKEILIEGHGEANLYVLMNRKYALLNYFQHGMSSGDGGVTSKNPNPPSHEEIEKEFQLGNGQHDFYPVKYLVSHEAALNSLITYFESGKKDPNIIWKYWQEI